MNKIIKNTRKKTAKPTRLDRELDIRAIEALVECLNSTETIELSCSERIISGEESNIRSSFSNENRQFIKDKIMNIARKI